MKTAEYWTAQKDKQIECALCPHHCRLASGNYGLCRTRQNIEGTLISLNYCRPVSTATDPIEKKPLYHFHPGTTIFSCGPSGCTFRCSFCQNHEISQELLPAREVSADTLVSTVVTSGTIGIAYTYSEPYIWFETIMEVAPAIKNHGLLNVMVSNGFMEPKPLGELLKVVDAMNIDIKSIRPQFYKKLCNGKLEPVLRTCETVKKHCHLEITHLVIPGENDTAAEFEELTNYIAGNLGRDTPLHLSRYFPRYRMSAPPTPADTLHLARVIAVEKLDYVYIGNTGGQEWTDTKCPSCAAVLIKRKGYSVTCTAGLISSGTAGRAACPSCGFTTNIRIG
jgi:pyruvate formate lyase activating enzyme